MDWNGPPTELQVMFAEKIGIDVTSEMSMRDLALLVVERRLEVQGDNPPTVGEVRFAISLGIDFEFCVVQVWELLPVLHTAIEQKTAEALRCNPDLIKPGLRLNYKGGDYIVKDGRVDAQWKVRIAPVDPTSELKTKSVHVLTIDDILAGRSTGEYD